MRKIVGLLAAAGMAISPVVASAQDASSLSLARAAHDVAGFSYLQDDEEDDDGGGSTAVILGVVLVVLIGIAASAATASGTP